MHGRALVLLLVLLSEPINRGLDMIRDSLNLNPVLGLRVERISQHVTVRAGFCVHLLGSERKIHLLDSPLGFARDDRPDQAAIIVIFMLDRLSRLPPHNAAVRDAETPGELHFGAEPRILR